MKTSTSTRLTFALCVAAMLAGPAIQVNALPPDPTNAALGYYQACLLYAKADDKTDDLLSDVAAGRTPVNDDIRSYIAKCSNAIETITEAARLKNCDWGVRYSEGFEAQLPHLGQVRHLARLVLADARIQAADGNMQAALEKCLVARRMARHVGNDMVISFLVSIAVDQMANECMADALGSGNIDAATLDRLSKALKAINTPPLSLEPAMKVERESALASMTMENVGTLIMAVNPELDAAEMKKTVEKMGGEKFLEANRQYYSSFMDRMEAILASGKPYAVCHKQLDELSSRLEADRDKDEAKLANIAVPALGRVYGLQVKARTAFNAILAAIEVYKVRAATGKLPASLPAGLPKDCFSGKDFKYEPGKAGFMLHCQARDLDKDTVHSYEFRVKP